ncbi:TetR/AcrR family transcriptional regulator [Sphingobacterium siyangense]|uniref:TetR family transcriptional regulator n=1 Tax=Sphingobacterium siyangense TaxID=459529 RepID=A0A562LZG5_9SPHI|nr:TetR/AcrR family transcriptional regulator [Sphingobacterium siyangense]TWI13067.1 TetR family transcriptional regulator [Sphingobacterium siyangense]
MNIANRKIQEKQEMSKKILNGARKIFLEKGYDQTSIRNIASEINYSPGTIYFYFKDKSEIFYELHREGFRLLLSKMEKNDSEQDPFERLKKNGQTYIEFAKEHKDYYNLMFIVEESKKEDRSEFNISKDAINHMKHTIEDCQKNGRLKQFDTDDFTFMMISVLHGICALFCKDRTNSFLNKTDEELMNSGYNCFVSLLGGA